MITKKEKMLIHLYRDAAGVKEADYRRLLNKHSGCQSCADRDFERIHFVHVMAALEALLCTRAEDGTVPAPARHLLRTRGEGFWRGQLAKAAPAGRITTSQVLRLNELWEQLREPLGERHTNEYFIGIVARATRKRDVGLSALTSAEASMAIDALQHKLTKALASAGSTDAAHDGEIP